MQCRTKITGYKVVTWIDPETKRKLFGCAVFVVGKGWAYLETAKRPAVYWSTAAAQSQLDAMKRQRTRAGYRRLSK